MLWIAIVLVVLGQFAITYLPFLQPIFGTESIHASDVFLILCVGIALFIIIEVEKRLRLHIRPPGKEQSTF